MVDVWKGLRAEIVSSSLLLISSPKEKVFKIKLIDLNSVFESEEPDEGFIRGLQSLIALLDRLINST